MVLIVENRIPYVWGMISPAFKQACLATLYGLPVKCLRCRGISDSLIGTCLRVAWKLERKSLHSENKGYNVTKRSLLYQTISPHYIFHI